jgi:DNA-binding response OmpR family regulator
MVTVVIIAAGKWPDDLESLLIGAKWIPRRLGLDRGTRDPGLLRHEESPNARQELEASRSVLLAHAELENVTRVIREVIAAHRNARPYVLVVVPRPDRPSGRRAIIRALRAGADDFVAAARIASELPLRLNALVRRARRWETPRSRCIGEIELERGTRLLRHGERAVSLTRSEYRVLTCLLERAGSPVTRPTIQKRLASISRSSKASMIDVYVLYLRRKLKQLETNCVIQTVRGVGYVLTSPPNIAPQNAGAERASGADRTAKKRPHALAVVR